MVPEEGNTFTVRSVNIENYKWIVKEVRQTYPTKFFLIENVMWQGNVLFASSESPEVHFRFESAGNNLWV